MQTLHGQQHPADVKSMYNTVLFFPKDSGINRHPTLIIVFQCEKPFSYIFRSSVMRGFDFIWGKPRALKDDWEKLNQWHVGGWYSHIK